MSTTVLCMYEGCRALFYHIELCGWLVGCGWGGGGVVYE